ncbi:unnamed protein product [Owenia fusiformis]|uniref:TIR domain-containing protein n=1 Tax=Owenia fusiformis TaxID=6347 RepID=A0A8S4N298_OWEFU|nr:unnamed protein product [Owenia fusiformis]
MLSLHLEDNDIKYIEQNIFQDVNVRNLDFDGNTNFRNYNFQTLLRSLQNKTVRSLLLNGCGIVIERFTASILQPLQNSSLAELQIGDNTIETFEGDAFEHVDSLIALRISNFMYISHFTLKPLKKLNQMIIADMPEVYYKQLAIIDLNEMDLIVLEISKINTHRVFFLFGNLTKLKSLSLANMGFVFIPNYYSQVLDLLGKSGRPFTFTDINLSGNLMFQLSSEKLCSLFWGIKVTHLYLQDNFFTALPTCMFQNSDINKLFLNRNRITHVQSDLFKNQGDIALIDLSQNAIQSIDGNAFANIFNAFVIEVKIDNNLLACNCEIRPFRNWLKYNNYRNLEYDEFCKSPNKRIKEKLLHFEITWLECNKDFFIKLCAISGSCFLITVILIATLLKYFWKDIKYKRMVWKAKHHNHVIPANDEEIYDAFVSYHSEKRIWVNQVMTRELCEGDLDFSLIHDDNIIPGQESYFSGIMTHMDRSRHIIFLVTRGWMKEGWNEFEMNAAIDMLSQSKRHTLIVILMENIPQKEMSGELRLMVRNNVCLKWSEEDGKQQRFWRDLKLELGKKKFHVM